MTQTIATERKELECHCCTLPFGYVQGGALVIVSRHNGDKHVNVLTLEKVKALLEESKA